ncbi:ABC transporter permease [Piscinibacter sakaiensis]|uniref:ABC transporter permease n=1 Tax=Piscinibacter sakaiensis TaxID=1547922 RepID=UPI003AB0E7FD
MRLWQTAAEVLRKEIVDALRDRRTLLVVLLSGVLMGPLVLIALSTLIAGFEARAEQRLVLVDGVAHAPTLVNFLQRQTFTVNAAPAEYEQQLRNSSLAEPVLRIDADFEQRLRDGELPRIAIVSDSANRRANAGAPQLARLIDAFNHERATLALALRGVAPALVKVVAVDEVDLAGPQTRALQITGMLPFFVIIAVLYGALNAALDTTAGERERGSLEPLLMNPAPQLALVIGKWGAVASVAFLIAVLSCLSFLPAQWLLRSESLQALFQYGLREALLFLVVLLPLAAALSAVLMAVAIRCRSFKEAQANSTLVVLVVSVLPLVAVFNPAGEAGWHLWLPALAQHNLMTRVLKGEGLDLQQMLIPGGVALALTIGGLLLLGRMLRHAAVK